MEQFLEFFSKKDTWDVKFYKDKDGDLNIRKLLYLDRDRLSDSCKKHALVTNGHINIFNFKALAFLICRGEPEKKCNILWDLIWNEKDCQHKRKQLKWDAKNLKNFFKKLLFFSEVFPKRFYKEYEKDMKTFDWRMKRGIKSLAKDPDWEEDKV